MQIKKERKLAMILLGVTVFSIATLLLNYAQVTYQLASPLIPKNVLQLIRKPFVDTGIIAMVLLLLASVLFLKKKYSSVLLFALLTC
jgi:hypothetical protein